MRDVVMVLACSVLCLTVLGVVEQPMLPQCNSLTGNVTVRQIYTNMCNTGKALAAHAANEDVQGAQTAGHVILHQQIKMQMHVCVLPVMQYAIQTQSTCALKAMCNTLQHETSCVSQHDGIQQPASSPNAHTSTHTTNTPFHRFRTPPAPRPGARSCHCPAAVVHPVAPQPQHHCPHQRQGQGGS